MKCSDCNKSMTLESCNNRDYWICDNCCNGYLANPKKNCEHWVGSIIFGVNGLAMCQDCGNLITYENKLKV